MKIGIDLDDIVFDMESSLIEIFNEINNNRFPEITRDNWQEYHLRDNFGIGAEIESEVFRIFSERRMLKKQLLFPYALESLQKLSLQNDLFIITSRGHYFANAIEDTFYSLRENKIPYKEIIFTPDKLDAARKLKLSFLVEDRLDCALQVAKYCPVYLFDYPYNRKERNGSKNLVVVPGFEKESWWHKFMEEFKWDGFRK